jgi:hypothetical protein
VFEKNLQCPSHGGQLHRHFLVVTREQLQRVPLEVNRRVGKGALCAPCPPLATDRVGTARAIKLACHSNDWSARAFAHPTNVIQFHRDLL